MGKRYVLLDRDGTVIVDKHYLHDPAGVELLPGAVEGLKRLQDMGFGLVLLTNQSGVGRGYFTDKDVRACNERMMELLEAEGVSFDAVYHCPHTPDDNCRCRKPEPGMMIQAAGELGFDPFEAFMIGDKSADVLLGKNTGAVAILVRTGKGSQEEAVCGEVADFVVDDLREAAEVIAGLKSKQDGRMDSPKRPQ